MKPAISLQSQLIKSSILSSVLAGMLALLVFLGLSVYHTMQIHDEIMDEVADMLVISDITSQAGSQIDEISEEFAIQYRLQSQDFSLVTSPDFHFQDLQPEPDYGVIWAEGQFWRSYVLDENDMQAQVYQPLSLRIQDLAEPVLWFAAILLLLWLLQWGLVHFSIQRQFKSLVLLSKDIGQKNAQDLSPIDTPEPEFRELQPILKQLNQLLARLDQSLHAEQRFTADASHELRSPLSAIQMRLQVLKRKYQDQSQLAQDLQPIQNDVTRSTQVLENLLLLARLDPSQAQNLPKSRCDLQQITLEVLEALLPFIEEKHIVLDLRLDECWVEGNRELLFTCIRNLVDNAVRYSPNAAVVNIHIAPLQKTVWISNQGEQLEPEVLARLGERFYRALGTKNSGSGLGISICQKIMDLHNGHLSFAAADTGGLIVQMKLI
jgi:two-component system, OmpR family, sensor histidine kinase QseC